MDYVIAGLAAGACLAIAGFLLREAGLSRRLSLPLWLADAGLAMMSAAVVTWLLTFTAIATDQDDDSAAAIILAGTAVSLVAAVLLVVHSGSRRRALITRTREPVRRAAPVIQSEAPRVQQERSEAAPTARPQEVVAAPQAKADWEAIWRETWGSGDLPRSLQTTAAPEPDTVPAAEAEPAWETWSSGEETDEPAADESEPDHADGESLAESTDSAAPASSSNGASQVLEHAKESE